MGNQEADTVKIKKSELKALMQEYVPREVTEKNHKLCPLGMTDESVNAANQLTDIIPELAKIANKAPDIIAAGTLYAEGKKTISTTVKVITIAGLVSVFIAGLWEKVRTIFK